MTGTPTFATPPGYMGLTRPRHDARIHIAGIPLDIGTTNRSGARFGPHAIRHASRMLVDGAHPTTWRDPLALPLADIGDFAIALGDIQASLTLIQQQAAQSPHLIALGGEHGITLPLLRALAGKRGAPLALVHFDAHVDTWPDSFGQAFGHGSPFYHAIREGIVDPKRMIQLGIRSPVQREVWDWTLAQGVTILTAQDIHELGPAATAARIIETAGPAAAYLTFDIDALDPAFAPGHRHAGNRRPRLLANPVYPAPPRRPRLGRHGHRRGGAGLRFRRNHRARRRHHRLGIPLPARRQPRARRIAPPPHHHTLLSRQAL